MEKTYKEPQFTLVRTDESNKVFLSASGTPSVPGTQGVGPTYTTSSTSGWF